jgi:tetratricopeptide (TPR) repeat protein
MRLGVVIALALVLARTAVAQPAPQPPASEKGDAKELMQLGVKLLKSKDYLGALAVFKDAFERFPSSKILLNIGTTLKLLDRNAEAANTYQRYLDARDSDPKRRAEVTREIADLDKGLAHLAITAPAEAELQIGDDEWIAPIDVGNYRVVPGGYTVRARRDGYRPFETSGRIAVGQTVAVAVTLDAIPKQPLIVRVPELEAPAVPEPARSRLGALALGHFDFKGGAAALVGGSFDVSARLELVAAGLIGHNSGGYAGASFAFLTGTLRPIVSAGMPVFFNDGARYAVRGAAGLELAANRHFALILEIGVEHALNPQAVIVVGGTMRTVDSTSIIPAIGATARL